jgi:hypothetical protein
VIATVKEMEAMVTAAMDKKLEEESTGCVEYREEKNVGGKPPQPQLLLKGVAGGETSNRKKAGAVGARLEEGAATKMDMVKYMKAAAVRIGDGKEFRRRMCVEYGKKWKSLKKVLEGEDTWITRVDTLKLGKGTTGSNAAKGSNQWRSPGAKKANGRTTRTKTTTAALTTLTTTTTTTTTTATTTATTTTTTATINNNNNNNPEGAWFDGS